MSTIVHPFWCEEGHRCAAERGGEHRSHPLTLDTPTARLIATRTATVTGHNRMEIRAVVDLPIDPQRAERAAHRALRHVHNALSAARKDRSG